MCAAVACAQAVAGRGKETKEKRKKRTVLGRGEESVKHFDRFCKCIGENLAEEDTQPNAAAPGTRL